MSVQMYYFPTNREEILSILASVNFNFKTSPTRIPVALTARAIPYQFTDNSTDVNESIPLSSNEKNFPILIATADKIKKNQINFSAIQYLVFRSPQEKDDFRFRAISEFDTESIYCVVKPELFQSLEKNRKKFTMVDLENDQNYHSCIISGILNLKHIASLKGFDPIVFENVFHKDDVSIQFLIQRILNLVEPSLHRESTDNLIMAIIHSILEHGKLNSAVLLQKIEDKWLDLWDVEAPPQDEIGWFKYLRSIINSTQVLNLDKLTDDSGSVFLRAATLMVMSDDLNVLQNFCNQSSRIGGKVLYLAAFLIGLKTPLHRRSWQDKKDTIPLIEECAAIIDTKKISKLVKPIKNTLYLAQGILVDTVEQEVCKLDIYHMHQRYYRVYAKDTKLQGSFVDVWNYDKNLNAYYVDWVSCPNMDELEKLIGLFDFGIIKNE